MKVLVEISDDGYPEMMIDTVKMIFEDEETKTKRIKYVRMEDFAGAIRAGLRSDDSCLVGQIPLGYYNAVIHSAKGFGCRAVLILPRREQRIIYMQTPYEMEMPSLVFGMEVTEKKLAKCRVFCIKDAQPSPKSQLFRFPLGNVSPLDGQVCWGSNPVPQITCLKDLETVMSLFLSYPFNSDHYSPEKNCAMEKFNLRDLCEYVQRAGRFEDDKILMPIDTKGARNLGELLTSMKI